MPRPTKPDPYNGFKDDKERRRALNTKVRSYSLATVVTAVLSAPVDWTAKLHALLALIQ